MPNNPKTYIEGNPNQSVAIVFSQDNKAERQQTNSDCEHNIP
jgi:hypothetical protein